MATSEGPDLSAGQAAFRRLADDTCSIRRAAEKSDMEPIEGTYELPVELGAQAYAGKCLVRPEGAQPSRDSNLQTGTDETTGRYLVKIPFPEALTYVGRDGDIIEVTSARRDPGLVGMRLIVVEGGARTMAVNRTLTCRVLTRGGVR